MIGNLTDLVAMPGMPSEPVIRKLIAEHQDFPIRSRGKNGVSYEFDLEAAARFILGLKEKAEAEARARAEQVRQLGLSLLGEDAAIAATPRAGLSIADQRELMAAEVDAIKAGRMRGELVKLADVETAIAAFVAAVVERMASFSARLSKRTALDRQTMLAVERLIDGDRRELARRMVELEDGIGSARNGDAAAAAALPAGGGDLPPAGAADGAEGSADGQPLG